MHLLEQCFNIGGTMRIKITYFLEQEVRLPYSLNHIISSYLYQMITIVEPDLGDWLHQEGLVYQNRTYKPIVFSNLHFEHRQNKLAYMKVKGRVTLYVDSIQNRIVQSLMQGIWNSGCLRINDLQIPLQDIQLIGQIEFSSRMQYQTLSPIVIPIQREDRLHFCHPLESDFYDQLRKSARNWYYLKSGKELSEDCSIRINLLEPDRFHLRKSSFLYEYKKKKIKGFALSMEIETSPEVQQVFYESGAGSLSSQGWGMLQVKGGE